jgi:SAM-dependent methyltransferase
VRGPVSPAARRALALYDAEPLGDRVHTVVRWWTAPFADLELEVPLDGPILEVGCGHGLLSCYMALAGRARSVVGTDIDAEKIEVARRAAARLRAGEADVRFEVGGGDEGRRRLLDQCVDASAPGGLLVVKEIDVVPRWKARLATVQELAATRVLRITEGEEVDFATPAALTAHLEQRGCTTMVKRLDHGYPHPHCAILATVPA